MTKRAGRGERSRPNTGSACRAAAILGGLVWSLAGCAPAIAPRPVVAQQQPKPHAPAAAPDWFHRELSLARHARVTFVPHGDQVGAQRAYYKVMVPACHRVAQSGPAKYRAQCSVLLRHAAAASAADAAALAPAADEFSCNDDHDDSRDDPAQVTACSD
jgi:hypothetical protein